MALNNTTKYKISNKFTNGKLNKDEFDFENKGNYGKGYFTWSTPVKKDGRTTFEYSRIMFVCFGGNVEIIANNLAAKFDITGNISQKRNPNATGDQPKTFWQIVVNEVRVLEDDSSEKAAKVVDKHNTAKANAYQVETTPALDDWEDDSVPF